MRVAVIFFSSNGDLLQLAKATAEGAADAGATVQLRRIASRDAATQDDGIPLAEPHDLLAADALLFGSPARFGMICPALRQLLHLADGGEGNAGLHLAGRVAGVFTDHNHPRPQSTLSSTYSALLHHGFILAALPRVLRHHRGEPGITPTALQDARTHGAHIARVAGRLLH